MGDTEINKTKRKTDEERRAFNSNGKRLIFVQNKVVKHSA
jgi:hypothetical protein